MFVSARYEYLGKLMAFIKIISGIICNIVRSPFYAANICYLQVIIILQSSPESDSIL